MIIAEICPECDADMEWAECWYCADGFIYEYEEVAPHVYIETSRERCDACDGEGGYWVCPFCEGEE